MFEVDVVAIKNYIKETGLKQKAISQRSGITESQICLILQGKRKFEAGEYASICNALGVSPNKFMKRRLPAEEV